MIRAKSVDHYVDGFPEETQKALTRLRKAIRKKMPAAAESISYGIPVFKLDGKPVIYFAGFKSHVSLYPAPRGIPEFKKELSAYKGGKGTVQFPLDEPIPMDLVERIILFRLREHYNT